MGGLFFLHPKSSLTSPIHGQVSFCLIRRRSELEMPDTSWWLKIPFQCTANEWTNHPLLSPSLSSKSSSSTFPNSSIGPVPRNSCNVSLWYIHFMNFETDHLLFIYSFPPTWIIQVSKNTLLKEQVKWFYLNK